MPTYKLSYFNARGGGEAIRFIFAQAGVEYEDNRLTSEQWAEFKPRTPYSVMPVLEVDGKIMGGSFPIARFLATRFGMAGEDDIAALILDGAVDAIKDLSQKAVATFFEKDEEKKAALKKDLAENIIPRVFGGLEKLAAANNCAEGWFYGPKVSYADIYFFHCITYVQNKDAPNVLDKYPALKKLNESVATLPNIAKWIKERPDTQF